ncbi:MAG TPA: GDP-mannose 4,6-dehydratase [Bacteroidales bacterium]|nr:GDP-mannose 4,6-dehydratase [Bacteroidales bacterium]
MKALITGGAGFAGSFLAEYLLDLGYEVAVADLESERWVKLSSVACKIPFFQVDVRDRRTVKKAIQSFRPDRLYHLAAQSSVAYSFQQPKETVDINFFGTLNVLETVAEVIPECRILVTCSAEEYGLVKPDENPIKESQVFRPVNPYAVSKIAQDAISFQYSVTHKLYVVRVRPFNHIGPRQSPAFAVASFAKQIAEIEQKRNEPNLRVGNLMAQRDFTDVRDIARAYYLALEHLPGGSVANVCSGRAMRIADVLSILQDMTEVELRIERDPARTRPSDIPVLVGDPTYINITTGWKPEILIERSLSYTLDYWRNQSRR